MDPATILADVTAALSIGNMLLNTVEDAVPYFVQAYDIATGKTSLTDADRATLSAKEAALRVQLNEDTIAADQP